MIKTTFRQILDRTSTNAIIKIKNAEIYGQSFIRIRKLFKALESEEKDFNEARIALCEKFADKDENNNSIKDEKGNFVIQENKETFDKEFEAMLDAQVELNCKKLSEFDVANAKLSVSELSYLMDIGVVKEFEENDK